MSRRELASSGSNIPAANARKEAEKENEYGSVGAVGERTGTNKLKWSKFSQILLRKTTKSIKKRRPVAARCAFRSFFPILFRNEAEMEQLAIELAVFEQFDMGKMGNLRAIWLKDAHFELLLNQWSVSPVCHAVELLGCDGCMTVIEKLEKRTNLAKEEQKENELNESSCFRDRFLSNNRRASSAATLPSTS